VGDYDHLIVVELVERHHVKAVAVPAGLCHQGHSLANENIYSHTANEGPVRIQYKRLVLLYVFPEMKLRGFVTSKTEL
jgi:hypothetical protein